MQEVLPLERVKNNFKTTIVKLTLKLKKDMVAYYQAETTYGNMTLIVEEFQIPHSDNSKESNIVQCFIQARNTLIRNDGLIVPLIYEQEVIKVQENILVCLTLTEPIEIIRRSQLSEFKETALFQNLVMSVYKASRSPFVYSSDCYSLQWVLRSVHTHLFSFDFTQLQERAFKQLQNNKSNTFQLFKRQLCRLMIDTRSGRMRQIILIKQRSVTFNIQNISQAKNEFDLALMFNLLQHEKVLVISQTKEKQFLVSKLNGKITIEYQHQRYQDLTFEGGFRMDAFTQLSLQTLKKQFFQDKMIYKIHKDRYQIVTKTHITSNYCWIKRDIEFSDLVLIDQQVSKSEFISFLIGYFKNVQPTLNLINFHKEQNAIRIQYVNKHNKIKTVLMKFNHKYVIKDEEVSMIIQKAKLKNTVLSLVGMMITDSFLMFLANCDKMLNITQLDISFCQQLSEIAIHSLFASPLCKNLKIIKIQKLPIINFAAVKFKNNLKDLHINQCSHQEEMLSFSGWNIQKLEAIGVNISMDLPRTLKYLSLSAEVELQSLRLLRNLQLTHLKIRIVQNKKNISNFLGAFSIKQSPVKVFAEGPSSKTLKLLDVSGSKIKLRQLRPIFMIQSLQTLIAEDIEREKFIELVLPQHIMNISFKNSQIIPQILTETLSRTIIIIKLNLCGTAIDQHSLAAFIKTKKYINLLDIDEQQLNFYLLQRKSGIQTLNLHVNKIIRDQHEHFLNKILIIQTQSSKQLNLLCNQKNEQKLVNKVNRFFKFYQVKLQKLTANMNLFINNIPLWKQIVYIREEEPHQNLSIYNPHAQQHKVKLHPIAFINSTLQQKILTLQLFNISLHKYLTQFPQSLVDISIRSNRILGIEAVDMIHKYAGSQLKSFDFRDCIFGYSQVKNTLYAFENLQLVNEGEYQIQMDDKDNCEQQLQRTLKFFMKLRDHEKMKLKIKASQIKQTQLFYSIVYEIIHQNQKNITYLNLQFANMRADNSQYLWKKVLSLKKIDTLKISYFNHKVTERQYSQLNGFIEQLSFCNLFALQIATNLTFLIPISLSSKNIRKINLQFWELSINENILIKILKNLHSLNHVEIRAADSQLANLNKLQDSLQKMHHLTHLNLNLQNCVLKQLQIYELISNLTKNKHLQRLQLNINNTNIQLPELVRVCELLQKNNKFCHIVVYAIQPRKQVLNRDESELIPRGIEIFYNY